MVEVDVQVPAQARSASLARIVERACAVNGLTLTLKGTLVQYPDCVHWHFKKGQERGTLEITWWERNRRLWFKVAARRQGAWTTDAMARLKKQIERALS